MKGLRILSTGSALPRRAVTNQELSTVTDTSDEWIVSRTGIRQRFFCEEETGTGLAAAAAKQAMERAGVCPAQIGACVVCTFTADYAAPANACLVQAALGLPEDAPAFDLNAGCTGFLYGLHTVRGLLLQSERPYALVIGAEVISRFLDFGDRSTSVLFGDGAAAVVVALEEGRLWDCALGVRGDARTLYVDRAIHMDGPAVFRFASETMAVCIREALERTGLSLSDLRRVVPHQANRRIIESAARHLSAPPELFYQNMARYGNTSAASIPIALDELSAGGELRAGDRLLCVGFGAGLTWGSALMQW